MFRLQIALITILAVCCVAFVSCDRGQNALEPVVDDMMTTDDPIGMMDYGSWEHVMLPVPTMTVEEAAAAMNPGGTGAVHGMGSRTVYFNEAGAMANKDGTMYPAGTMIVKEIMDDTNMFVQKIAKMEKTDDPMYADHDGWMYAKYARASEMDPYMMVGGGSLEASTGCYGCHAKAANDSVFVSLMADTMDANMADTMDANMDNGGDQ